MRPAENARGRLPGEIGAPKIALGGGDKSTVAGGRAIPAPRRWTGCPCGCMTKLPYFDDPDCVRHLPIPEPRDRERYDVAALGLVPHDRETCGACLAVGA